MPESREGSILITSAPFTSIISQSSEKLPFLIAVIIDAAFPLPISDDNLDILTLPATATFTVSPTSKLSLSYSYVYVVADVSVTEM